MLPDGAVSATRVWKRFRADRRQAFVRYQLARLAARARKESSPGWRWALRDVDFRVEPGEAFAIVGSNGSGKSTLLKILTRVMYPHSGRVEIGGRVGALIEVRAGLHPQLSGRENVYLYGSLLGLPRRNVAMRFDEIVGFAELENAIDRQIKFYSTGMQMRLGFAVAAFLEPDVLAVDEVLAVGDAAFQQKCLDRMTAVLNQGTTLLFVSHDLAAVEAMCTRGIWIDQGVVHQVGPIRELLTSYRRSIEEGAELTARNSGPVTLLKAGPVGSGVPTAGEEFDVQLIVKSDEKRSIHAFLGVSEGPATPIFVLSRHLDLGAGETEVRCHVSSLPLPRGRYYLWVGICSAEGDELVGWHPVVPFDVGGPLLEDAPKGVARLAPIHVISTWEVDSE